jgi:hypothetical protein
MCGYNFKEDQKIDRAAAEGFKAGSEGTRVPPFKYASEDLLLSAWRVGNNKGLMNSILADSRSSKEALCISKK